jgi:DNA-binding MarR family transcriptional regulator
MLGLLESVERDGDKSQRRLASELGIALGLVNAYLKRLVSKGMVKVREAPARRYAYYLTPQGFSEKSRLTVQYLSYSFSLFRQAKQDCVAVFQTARSRGYSRIALAGASDLAEIVAICALEGGVTIAAVIDPHTELSHFAGLPVARSFDGLNERVDAVIITDFADPRAAIDAAVEHFGADRVLVPALLGLHVGQVRGEPQ